jgi:predicted MFS family arabinose efflux permease
MVLGWVTGGIISGYLLLRLGPRWIVLTATVIMTVGASLLIRLHAGSPQTLALASVLLIGFGMGLSIIAYLVSVQSRVARRRLGVATSTIQFVRQVGGTVGVSLMGAVMAARLQTGLTQLPGGAEVDPQALLDRTAEVTLPPEIAAAFQQLLSGALQPAFFIALVAVVLALLVAWLTPGGTTQELAAQGERGSERESEELLAHARRA